MNLLILGAGGHGFVCKEVAEAMKIYDKIDFLDDNAIKAIGKISDYQELLENYSHAFVGIGDNTLRFNLLGKLKEYGYQIPILIHPTAYVSPSATIGLGSIIEPHAIVNAKVTIGEGVIVSVGSIVDHDAAIGSCAHVNAGAICKAGSHIESLVKLQAGEMVLGY